MCPGNIPMLQPDAMVKPRQAEKGDTMDDILQEGQRRALEIRERTADAT